MCLGQASNLDLFSASQPNEFAETLSFLLEFWVLLLSFDGLTWDLSLFCLLFKFYLTFELFLTNKVKMIVFCVH